MNIVPFQFEQSEVRAVVINGDPWFVAADVLRPLALDRKAMERLDEDEKGVNSVHTPGGMQQMTVVSEAGLYALVLGSRKPKAKEFKRWITHVVLPEIRKTGSYSAAPALPNFADPVAAARAWADAKEAEQKAVAALADAAPKVAALDRIAGTDGSSSLTEAAKNVAMKPKAFIEWLRARRWIYRHALSATWLAYQPRLDSGMLVHKVITFEGSDGDRTTTQVRVTPKGLARIAELLERESVAA